MRVFTCKDQFEDIMTCIYDAWSWALKNGHENLRLEREPIFQPTLFDEYTHIDADMEKVTKVVRSIQNKISMEAYIDIFYATLSIEPDALDTIYGFLRLGFRVGARVCSMYTDPHVMRILELRRRVGNEAHYFREFARFSAMGDTAYICHLEPKNNVILLVGEHFADRMPSEHWMIIDDNRRQAVVHVKNQENYLRYLSEEEWLQLSRSELYEDSYTDMWRTFFHAIGIKQRENRECQRNLFPIWMRKHAVEFQDSSTI